MDGGDSTVDKVGEKPSGEDVDACNQEDDEEKNGVSS